jgi:hypothetical protein
LQRKTVVFELLSLCALIGQVGKAPPVDMAEAVRRGESVTVVGEGPRGGSEEAFRLAVAPPPDDSGKWFVTVWTGPGCAPCEKLKKDFRNSPALLSFVAAPPGRLAWAHYNEYRTDDQTQASRRAAYKISAVPTVIVQPPVNGTWGNPRTVVFYEQGYDGRPEKLAERISAAVKSFSEVMAREGYPKPPNNAPRYGAKDLDFDALQASELKEGAKSPRPFFVQGAAQAEKGSDLIGQGPYYGPPPFPQPPAVDPFNPQYPQPNQTIPPSIPPATPSLTGGINWLGILQFVSTNGLLFLLLAMEVLKRLAPVTVTKLDDQTLALLQRLTRTDGAVPGGRPPTQ